MAGFVRPLRAVGLLLASLTMLMLLTAPPADAVGGEGEGWPSFNESDGCGSPWMRGPNVERSGWLNSSEVLRGPHADYFGRTISQVWDSLEWWDVPMSNGETIRLHERMQPALAEVEVNLAQAASDGYLYNIIDRYTFGYAARTIGGAYRVSQHALGNAIDINSVSNPYTTGALRTNMPSWFVDALSDAGFCWGGYWVTVKDAMHYNWRGPLFTPGVTELPPSYSPLTSPQDFTRTMYTTTVPASLDTETHRLLMDGDGDGAVDVVALSNTAFGGVVDVVRARTGYLGCGVSRYPAPEIAADSVAINGDWDRDGAQDVWLIEDSAGITITALLRETDFAESETLSLGHPAGTRYLAGDHDVDGWSDLYVLTDNGGSWSVTVYSGSSRFVDVLATGTVNAPSEASFTLIDRTKDHVPDLVAVSSASTIIADGASSFSSTETLAGIPLGSTDIAGADFDGDGRHDLVFVEGETLTVRAGNSPLGGVSVTSWFEFPTYSCGPSALPYPYEGTFRDDDWSVHRYDIDEIFARGVTKGCNPSLGDKFCPDREITRGELAAFLGRALELPWHSSDQFTDIGDSIFVADIERLAAAGGAVACNDTGTEFCPDQVVKRDVMAGFLVAAFGYEPSDEDRFVDDEHSKYEDAINAIAAVDVTRGCNPPDFDRFCPDRDVTRAEMASFMVRAMDLLVE